MARILIVNKFYYLRGGDCTAAISLENLLREKGHDVAIFSTQHSLNNFTKWNTYFPSEVNLSAPKISDLLTVFFRPFYSSEVKRKFTQIVNDFKPDIIHVHNIHSYLSPYVVKIAASKGIKVFWTLHDYKLLCPAYTCIRNGKPCELCFHSKRHVLKYKCVKNSFAASFIAYFEAKVWNRKVLEKYTEKFICPSFFIQSKMLQGGFKKEKTVVLHNFFQPTFHSLLSAKEDYYCYIGRLSPEKGVDTLLKAAKQLPFPLKIIGGGDKLVEYQNDYKGSNIEFIGHLPHSELLPLLQKARFSVVPSECYENNPFSIIESLCMGTPVVGADIGGIPELIQENINGLLFLPHNENMLKRQISKAFSIFTPSFDYSAISYNAGKKFDRDNFYNHLMHIYEMND